MSITAYIELDEDLVDGLEYGEYKVEVEYTATPYRPAYTSGPPDRCYPEEGGEVEIESATLPDGRELYGVYKGDFSKLESSIMYWIEKHESEAEPWDVYL